MLHESRYYWKFNEKAILFEETKDNFFLLKMIALTSTPSALLYNRIMNAAQKLTCKKLRADGDYQSVLNVQERRVAPFRAAEN